MDQEYCMNGTIYGRSIGREQRLCAEWISETALFFDAVAFTSFTVSNNPQAATQLSESHDLSQFSTKCSRKRAVLSTP